MKKPRLGENRGLGFGVDGTCTADHEAIRYLQNSATTSLPAVTWRQHHKEKRPTEADALELVVGGSVPVTANVPCTPHRAPANVATGGSRHAATID